MNITVTLDKATLATVIEQVTGIDEDGDEYEIGGRTIGDAVAGQITARLIKETAYYGRLRDEVAQIRKEAIQDAVRPLIEKALAGPIPQTNLYGERTGKSLTILELVVEEIATLLGAKSDRYRSDSPTLLQQTIKTEVQKAMQAEITGAVQSVRDALAGQVGDQLRQHAVEAVETALRGSIKTS
ncbi:hypothetical protein ABH931_006115 [Streptacidiphilus sp. MAP12-33]|uniref:hypothetical protein n=1 Tax=Streptacidiphilus sp. MAP12-33 TaxID=3156266 RepID=UPI003518AB80